MSKKTPPSNPRVTLADIVNLKSDEGAKGSFSQIKDQSSPTLKELTECLSFSPGDGRIWMNDQRMLLLHGSSFGLMRQQIIDSIGYDSARRLFMRVGYKSGARDANLVRQKWPDAEPASIFAAGTQLHSLEGAVQVEPIHFEFDKDKGTYTGEFYWHNSCEAEQHIKSHGVSTQPVCWMEVGYAIGYVSCLLSTLVIFRESECLGMGHSQCKLVGKNANQWPEGERELDFLSEINVDKAITKNADVDVIPPLEPKNESKIIGVSSAFLSAVQALDKVAKTDATVLLTGESGVGKELFASSLHQKSKRREKPFVAFNCAAIPDNLLESELFGVEKGAYTGASHSRAGRFERANGGTLFLDELGTLSMAGQSKLLRALQEKEIERVGGNHPINVDVRVVAATNMQLLDAVKNGEFREDLYFRLNVFPITLPPLRDRRDDIPLLLDYFFHKFCHLHEKHIPGITTKASRALLSYDFPGNIRELQNIVERGVIWTEDNEPIDLHHMFHNESLPEPLLYSVNESGELSSENQTPAFLLEELDAMTQKNFSLDELERTLLFEAVELESGNLSAAARRLGISRAQLAYRLKKFET